MYCSPYSQRTLTSCSLTIQQEIPDEKKIRKNENGCLPIVNLHLYVDFGPKQTTIFHFDVLFEYIGFEIFFECFFSFFCNW
jgi:hypothetical protein